MLLKYITLASALNFLLLSFVLFTKKSPVKKANSIMGVLLLVMAIYSFLVSYRFTAIIEHNYTALNNYSPIDGIFMLLMAPSLYFYILSILDRPPKFLQWKMLTHLIPIIPFVIFNLIFIQLPQQERINWFIKDFIVGTIETNILNIVIYVQMPVYLLISYYLIKKQLKTTSKVLFNGVLIEISWLKSFLIINISFIAISAPLCFYFANEKANILIGELAMNFQFLYIFFKTVWQKNIFSSENLPDLKKSVPTLKIEENIAENYVFTLIQFMESQKPYLKEDCSLQTISDRTEIPLHQLSNILNTRLNKSFPEFINDYRIAESKRLLHSKSTKNLTLETIGYECGFGSRSGFNKAFKRHTNISPNEFRKQFRT